MGSWSIKPFGNDSALDWLSGVQKSKDGKEIISIAVESIINGYDGCATKAEEAIAAISIISAATNDPVKGTSQDAKSWVNISGFVPTFDLIDKALSALEIVTTDSELYDLWAESNSLKTWLKDIEKIKSVLEKSKGTELPKRKPKKQSMPRSLHKLLEFYQIRPEAKVREKIFSKVSAIDNINEGSSDTDYTLPLTLLSKYGFLDEIKYLLSKGADPNAQTSFGGPALITACAYGHIEVADLLINAGAEIFGETVMDDNTGYRYNPELYADSSNTPQLKTYKYCTALFSVSSMGRPRAIDYLISKGASIHQIDLNGETLVHKACYYENISALEHLVKLGVDVNKSKGIVNGNRNSRGETALHYAVAKDKPDAARLLLENGADPNIVEYFKGNTHNWANTPLDLVDPIEKAEMHNLLVEYGALLAEELE